MHQGFEIGGPQAGRAILIRRYNDAWLELGLFKREAEIRRNLLHLGHLRAYQGCHLANDGSPHLVWPLLQGRSLRQVLDTAERKEFPLGLDQALFVTWALTHHISLLQRVHMPVGFLAPHRVWVGFNGLLQILDTPVVSLMTPLLPQEEASQKAVAPYLQGPAEEGLPHASFQLGLLLYEMLTHHPMPLIQGSPDLTRCMASREGEAEPLPTSVKMLLLRLLGENPYASLKQLEEDLEQLLFGGDYNPTTFGLAFTMHTLFRRELEAEEDEARQAAILRPDETQALPLAGGVKSKPNRRWVLALASSFLALTTVFAARHWSARTIPMPELSSPSLIQPPQEPKSEPIMSEVPRVPADEKAPMPEAEPEPRTEPKTLVQARPILEPKSKQVAFQRVQDVSIKQPQPVLPAIPPKAQPLPSVATMVVAPTALPVAPQAKPQSNREAPKLQSVANVSGGQPVRFRVFVDEQGRVRQIHLIQGAAPGSSQERAASLAAMQARFLPAKLDGNPVRDWTEITVQVK